MITNLREQIQRDEGGYQRFCYQDSRGYWTIGFGRCVDRKIGKGISLAEAEAMLDADLLEFSTSVLAGLPWTYRLDEPRRAVLVGLAYNIGMGDADRGTGLLGFKKMLAAVESGDYPVAAQALLDSKYRKQVGLRCDRLARQLETGEWT